VIEKTVITTAIQKNVTITTTIVTTAQEHLVVPALHTAIITHTNHAPELLKEKETQEKRGKEPLLHHVHVPDPILHEIKREGPKKMGIRSLIKHLLHQPKLIMKSMMKFQLKRVEDMYLNPLNHLVI